MPQIIMLKADPERAHAALFAQLTSKQTIARKAGVSVGTVSHFFTGKPIGAEKMRAIARALDVPLRSLLQEPSGRPDAAQTGTRAAVAL